MKLKTIYLFLVFLPTLIQGVILESDRIDVLLQHADNETLVVLDLNDTLMSTVEYVGSDTWAAKEIATEMDQSGKSKSQVYDTFIPIWHRILLGCTVKPVEEKTPEVITSLQKNGISVVGLTARYIEMAYPTIESLKSIGIDLSVGHWGGIDIEIEGGFAAKYIEGIIFSGLKNAKGDTLVRFFRQQGIQPVKVVYADDKLKHVHSVHTALEQMGIECIAIHYRKGNQ